MSRARGRGVEEKQGKKGQRGSCGSRRGGDPTSRFGGKVGFSRKKRKKTRARVRHLRALLGRVMPKAGDDHERGVARTSSEVSPSTAADSTTASAVSSAGGASTGCVCVGGGWRRAARGKTASAIVRISIDYARRERASKLALTTPRRRNRASASSVRARGATRRVDRAPAVISCGDGRAETRGARDARRARARAASRRRIHNRRSSRSVVHIEGDGVGRRARFGFRAGGAYLPPQCSSLLPRQTS